MAQWTMRLTMNQKIAGLSPARIDRVLCDKDLDRLVGVLVRNVIHYVPVLLPSHDLSVHNIFHNVPVTKAVGETRER